MYLSLSVHLGYRCNIADSIDEFALNSSPPPPANFDSMTTLRMVGREEKIRGSFLEGLLFGRNNLDIYVKLILRKMSNSRLITSGRIRFSDPAGEARYFRMRDATNEIKKVEKEKRKEEKGLWPIRANLVPFHVGSKGEISPFGVPAFSCQTNVYLFLSPQRGKESFAPLNFPCRVELLRVSIFSRRRDQSERPRERPPLLQNPVRIDNAR